MSQMTEVLKTRLGTWYGLRRPAPKARCVLKVKPHFCFNECKER